MNRFQKDMFYRSPFIIMFICSLLSIILYLINLRYSFFTQNTILAPIYFEIIYFLLWFFYIFFLFVIFGKPRKKINLEIILDEAKNNNWKIINYKKRYNNEVIFKIDGIENGNEFLLVREMDLPGEIINFYTTAIYIKSKNGENYDIFEEDIKGNKNITTNSKENFINKTKDNLIWLMDKNNFITKISFYNGTVGIIINDNTQYIPYLKEILKKLFNIIEIYNQSQKNQ